MSARPLPPGTALEGEDGHTYVVTDGHFATRGRGYPSVDIDAPGNAGGKFFGSNVHAQRAAEQTRVRPHPFDAVVASESQARDWRGHAVAPGESDATAREAARATDAVVKLANETIRHDAIDALHAGTATKAQLLDLARTGDEYAVLARDLLGEDSHALLLATRFSGPSGLSLDLSGAEIEALEAEADRLASLTPAQLEAENRAREMLS